MKYVWRSMQPTPAPARTGSCCARWFDGRVDPVWPRGRAFSANHMKYRCKCGALYVVIPKEIPLAKTEQPTCDNCGCELHGQWSSRYFDYEPFC